MATFFPPPKKGMPRLLGLWTKEMSALHATHSFNASKEIPRQVRLRRPRFKGLGFRVQGLGFRGFGVPAWGTLTNKGYYKVYARDYSSFDGYFGGYCWE